MSLTSKENNEKTEKNLDQINPKTDAGNESEEDVPEQIFILSQFLKLHVQTLSAKYDLPIGCSTYTNPEIAHSVRDLLFKARAGLTKSNAFTNELLPFVCQDEEENENDKQDQTSKKVEKDKEHQKDKKEKDNANEEPQSDKPSKKDSKPKKEPVSRFIDAILTDDFLNQDFLSNLILQSSVTYINNCWRDYHKRSDNFIVTTFDTLKQAGQIHRNACVFNWVWQTLKMLIDSVSDCISNQSFPNVAVQDADEFRAYMISIVSICAEEMRESLSEATKNVKCDPNCPEDAFDGSDFISMTTKPQPKKKGKTG
ncbi:cylicin, basic protein of sperm head cytoskeleton 2 [Reticulomyxa filosa]|uniref:Cylicin, basic protein of sperm head cytoskeleton 2 n=1 Tax=Reticulomyxa filosa TaxID=46433 RepID=X6M1D1_RETFI|nr:cylicin, basic protein of sperm head cytoskeleton 2 [Reticulomyxa filosa]|eukprot:ETO07386.1 cylicin, basic protein of sperm head cytoskeleton 2 [Reticulomyxa filosa]